MTAFDDNYWMRRRINRRSLIRTGALGVAGLAGATLIGCGDSDDAPDESGTPAAGASGGDATSAASGSTTPSEPSIDVIRAGVAQEPPSFDVHRAYGGAYEYFMTNVYEGLIGTNEVREQVPELAESWEASEDFSEYTFNLRRGVTFHSGDPFTAEDVLYSFERYKDPDIQPRQATLEEWERVEVIDDYTVKLHLTAPNPLWLRVRAGSLRIVSKDYLEREGLDILESAPVGTGPYQFASRAVKEHWELEAFSDYWGGTPTAKRVRFEIIPEPSTLAAALEAGELDFASNIAPQFSANFDGNGFRLIRNPASNTIDLRINLKRQFTPDGDPNPYLDVRVRTAMDYALDRDAIIENILFGFGEKITGLFPEDIGHPDELEPYPYAPAEAAKLLSAAGYDGLEARLWGLLGQRVPNASLVGEAMAGFFTDVGLITDVRNEEYAQWLRRVTPGQSFDTPDENWPFAFGITFIGGGSHPGWNLDFFSSSDGSTSWVGLVAEGELDELIDKCWLPENQDEERLAEVVADAARWIYDNHVVTLGYRNVAGYAMKDTIDFTPTANSQYIEAWNIHPASNA